MNAPNQPAATVRPYVSFVLPCFNEGAVLKETYRRVKAVGEALQRAYEIVAVNDGPSDDTLALLLNLAVDDETLVVVDLSRNHGHQLALSAGLHHCAGERILIMDADLQDPPELLPDIEQLKGRPLFIVNGVHRKANWRTSDSPRKRLMSLPTS